MYKIAKYKYKIPVDIYTEVALHRAGYGFLGIELYKGDVTGEYEYKGIKWWVREITPKGKVPHYVATEFKSGAMIGCSLVSEIKNLTLLNENIRNIIDRQGEVFINALVSRLLLGQAGVRMLPTDLFIYGIIK